MFPHSKAEPEEYGNSPGNGITPVPLSRDPLATEGEATPGPDDWNPYDEMEEERARERFNQQQREDQEMQMEFPEMPAMLQGKSESPTDGDDPFAFDDVGIGIRELQLPGLSDE